MTQTPTRSRRVTPAARLVLPATASRDQWLAERRRGIGSSDVAAVMGVPPRTALHVYYDKRGDLPLDDDAGEAALWGTLHEETVAREWYRRNRSVGHRIGLVAHIEDDWMRCTLDRRITECPLNREQRETCALEVKTRSAWLATKWRRDVPDDVLAQTLWQIAVTGFDHIHVAVLIGGNDYRQKVVRRRGNEQLIADIVEVARRLWNGNIAAGVPPTVEPSDATADLYDQLYPERDGITRFAPDKELEVAEVLRDYELARLAGGRAERAKKAARARLIELLGGGEIAVLDDRPAYSYEPTSRQTPDVRRLAERWPDAYADCVPDKPGHRLVIEKQYRLTEDALEES